MNSRRHFLGTISAGLAGAVTPVRATVEPDALPRPPQDGSSSAWFQSRSAPYLQKLSQPQYDIRFEYQVDIPSYQIDHRRRTAFIGHMLHFHTGQVVEKFSRKVIRKAYA